MFKKKGYSTFEISKICGVYPTTVINWINQGKLKAYSTPGGHHRVTKEDLIKFLKEYNFPIPPELEDKKKVFIVDDDEIFRETLFKAFSKKSEIFETSKYSDGYEALISVGKNKPHLMIIDIVMPKMDGLTLIKKLKENKEFSDIKIIVVSGEEIEDDKLNEIKNLTDGFFKKPIDIKNLLEHSINIFKE